MYLVFRRGLFTAWILPCIFSHSTCFPLRIIYSLNAWEKIHCSLCRRSFRKFKPLAWPWAVIQQTLVGLPRGLEAGPYYRRRFCCQVSTHVPLSLLQGSRWARRSAHVKAEPWGVNPRSHGWEHPPAEGCVALRWGNGQMGHRLDFSFSVSLSEWWPACAFGKATVMHHCSFCLVVGNVVSLHFLTLWTRFKNCDSYQEGKMPRHNQLTQRKLNLDRQYEKSSPLKSVVKFPLMSEVLLFYPWFSWFLYVHKSCEVAVTS